MSVDRRDYIVYGWKLPYELKNANGEEIDLWDDKYLSMIEGHKDEKFIIVPDGMSGNYVVFGLNLQSGGESWEGWDFVHLDFKTLDAYTVKKKYKEVFETEPVSEPSLFIFSHFS